MHDHDKVELCPCCGAKLKDNPDSFVDGRQGLYNPWIVIHCGACGITLSMEDNDSHKVKCEGCGKEYIFDPELAEAGLSNCPECDEEYKGD